MPAAAAAASAAAPPVAPTAAAGFVAVPRVPASIARRRAAFEMEQAQALLKKQQVSIRCTLECRDIPAFPARRLRESDDPVDAVNIAEALHGACQQMACICNIIWCCIFSTCPKLPYHVQAGRRGGRPAGRLHGSGGAAGGAKPIRILHKFQILIH